ncbi:hypothetical protein FQN57_003882 [Myotisia sp. PD_48]|nr:hypothetical protein FQN57_003882 [Myotisia sp. PD_48]
MGDRSSERRNPTAEGQKPNPLRSTGARIQQWFRRGRRGGQGVRGLPAGLATQTGQAVPADAVSTASSQALILPTFDEMMEEIAEEEAAKEATNCITPMNTLLSPIPQRPSDMAGPSRLQGLVEEPPADPRSSDSIRDVSPLSPSLRNLGRGLSTPSIIGPDLDDPLIAANSSTPLTELEVQRSRTLLLENAAGRKLPFSEILDELTKLHATQVLVLFIRHFSCGYSLEYVRKLTEHFPNPAGDLPALTHFVVVGCGASTHIIPFLDNTGCPFAVYTEPTRALQKHLGLKRKLSIGNGNARTVYTKRSSISLTFRGLGHGLRRIPHGDAHRGGNILQTGGAFLFEFQRSEPDAGKFAIRNTWCYKMQNSADFPGIPVLRRVLGVSNG